MGHWDLNTNGMAGTKASFEWIQKSGSKTMKTEYRQLFLGTCDIKGSRTNRGARER